MLRGEFLPGQQVTEEIRCGYRLDLLPQTVERVTVNACEQAARTPFSLGGAGRERRGEITRDPPLIVSTRSFNSLTLARRGNALTAHQLPTSTTMTITTHESATRLGDINASFEISIIRSNRWRRRANALAGASGGSSEKARSALT